MILSAELRIHDKAVVNSESMTVPLEIICHPINGDFKWQDADLA